LYVIQKNYRCDSPNHPPIHALTLNMIWYKRMFCFVQTLKKIQLFCEWLVFCLHFFLEQNYMGESNPCLKRWIQKICQSNVKILEKHPQSKNQMWISCFLKVQKRVETWLKVQKSPYPKQHGSWKQRAIIESIITFKGFTSYQVLLSFQFWIVGPKGKFYMVKF
jgi:hypothetical protein